MTVPHIPFVEAIFESLEITYLNRQISLIDVLKGFFKRLLRMPVNKLSNDSFLLLDNSKTFYLTVKKSLAYLPTS